MASWESPRNLGIVTFVLAAGLFYLYTVKGLLSLVVGLIFGVAAYFAYRTYVRLDYEDKKEYRKMDWEMEKVQETPRREKKIEEWHTS